MNKGAFLWILFAILVLAAIVWLVRTPSRPSHLDAFAGCLADSGATFYGAFWCPHCANQKALFGSAARLLPYTECSAPDGRSQLSICTDAGVTTYPTWKFADGSQEVGVLSIEKLSELTGCALPDDSAADALSGDTEALGGSSNVSVEESPELPESE